MYDAGELSRERDREKEKNQVSYMALTLGLRDSGMGIKHRRIKTTKNFLCLKKRYNYTIAYVCVRELDSYFKSPASEG